MINVIGTRADLCKVIYYLGQMQADMWFFLGDEFNGAPNKVLLDNRHHVGVVYKPHSAKTVVMCLHYPQDIWSSNALFICIGFLHFHNGLLPSDSALRPTM
jgi:hypothetical protein